ncbi:MAG: endo-1,4-beta-xylanase [Polyangiaceae bacterium]
MICKRTTTTAVVATLLALSSCIKREPVNATTSASASSASPVSAKPTQAADAAPSTPTGLYGKVAGTDLLQGKGISGFELFGQKDRVNLTTVPVEGMPFKSAYRAQILSTPTNNWDVQLFAKTTMQVEKGDVLLATLYFRTEWAPQESGEGESEFVFELSRDPYTKSVTYPLRASRDWKKIYVPFVAAQAYTPGSAQMILRLGYQKEIVEFGGISVENFGKQLALADLPVTTITYRGMELDAPWRTVAAERIDKLRKAPLSVVVTDAAGKPLADAEVKVTLSEHAFGFGTCVPAGRIVSANPADERFKAVVKELFNVATLENDLKWVPLAGDWGSAFTVARATSAIDWLTAKGLDVRGHVLVWPGWQNLPKSLRALEGDATKLRAEVDKHIRETATAMKGKVVHWDVLNEPYDNHDLIDILGNEAMVDWFKAARASDPDAQLFVNDYAILSGGGGTTPHRDHYEKTIRMLLDKGAPLDGIGMQGHFGNSLTAPEDLTLILDRYAKFNKTIWVTEYDINIDNEGLAAGYTRDFYTTLFSHPAVGGIVMWGFWDGSHWKNNAPLYRRDWSLKPAGEAYRELVKKLWHTDQTLRTDPQGTISLRGFLGTYNIVVSAKGRN